MYTIFECRVFMSCLEYVNSVVVDADDTTIRKHKKTLLFWVLILFLMKLREVVVVIILTTSSSFIKNGINAKNFFISTCFCMQCHQHQLTTLLDTLVFLILIFFLYRVWKDTFFLKIWHVTLLYYLYSIVLGSSFKWLIDNLSYSIVLCGHTSFYMHTFRHTVDSE